MSDILDKMGVSVFKTQQQGFDLINKLIETARPGAVFGQPVTSGDYTVITASEVSCGLGLGFGGGGNVNGVQDQADNQATTRDAPPAGNVGTGGGAGGFSTARPVAAISVGPDGVHVEPIVDVMKVALALFTTLGAMAMMRNNVRRAARK